MFPFLEGIDGHLSLATRTPLPTTEDPLLQSGLLVATIHPSFLYENQDMLPNVSMGTLQALRTVGANFEMRTLAVRLFLELPEAPAAQLSQQMAGQIKSANKVVQASEWLRANSRLGVGERSNGPWSARTAVEQLHQIVGWLVIVDRWASAEQLLPSLSMPLRTTRWPDPVTSVLSVFGQQDVEWEYEESGPNHDRSYVCRLLVAGSAAAEGIGRTKKEARFEAALEALEGRAPEVERRAARPGSKSPGVIHAGDTAGFDRLREVARLIDIEGGELHRVEQALIHSSWIYENQQIASRHGQVDNSRLAWLGSYTVNLDSAVASASQSLREQSADYSFRSPESVELEAAALACGLPSLMFLGQGQRNSVSQAMAADVFQAVHAVKALSDGQRYPFAGAKGSWAEARRIVASDTPKSVDEKTDLQEYANALGLEVSYGEESRGAHNDRSFRSIAALGSQEMAKSVRVGGPWCSSKTKAQRAVAGKVLGILKPGLSREGAKGIDPTSAQGHLMNFVLKHIRATPPGDSRRVSSWLRKGLFGLSSRMTPQELGEAIDQWEAACRHFQCPFVDQDAVTRFVEASLGATPPNTLLDSLVNDAIREAAAACADDKSEEFAFETHIERISGIANLLRIRGRVGDATYVAEDLRDLELLLRSEILPRDRVACVSSESRWSAGSSEALNFLLRNMRKIDPQVNYTEHVDFDGSSLVVVLESSGLQDSSFLTEFVPALSESLPGIRSSVVSGLPTVWLDTVGTEKFQRHSELVFAAWRERVSVVDAMVAEQLHNVKNHMSGAQAAAKRTVFVRREFLERELAVRQHLDHAVRDLLELQWRTKLTAIDWGATCNLTAELSSFVSDVLPRLPDGCKLNSSIPGTQLHVLVSGAEVQVVTANLFKNALEAIDGVGAISIEVGTDKGGAFLEVRDDGPGLPGLTDVNDGEWPTETSKLGGSGLGIATIRRVVGRAGGTVDFVTSTQGTRVRVVFPLASIGDL